MTYPRLSAAQIRADHADLGTVAAVARKHGVSSKVIIRRAPNLRRAQRGCGANEPLRRAVFLHSIGLTLDEAAAAAGITVTAAVRALRARAATAHTGR